MNSDGPRTRVERARVTTKESQLEFRVVVEAQSDAYHAYCPNLQGCHSWGSTVEEAMHYIEEALQFYVDNVNDESEEDFDDEFDDIDIPPPLIYN